MSGIWGSSPCNLLIPHPPCSFNNTPMGGRANPQSPVLLSSRMFKDQFTSPVLVLDLGSQSLRNFQWLCILQIVRYVWSREVHINSVTATMHEDTMKNGLLTDVRKLLHTEIIIIVTKSLPPKDRPKTGFTFTAENETKTKLFCRSAETKTKLCIFSKTLKNKWLLLIQHPYHITASRSHAEISRSRGRFHP